jgi:hypothetical protein
MKKRLEKYYRWLAVGIIVAYAAVNLYCTARLSITGDELAYFAYGVNMWKGQPQKTVNPQGIPVFNSQMPINALHVLPRAVEQALRPGLEKTQAQAGVDIYRGRWVSVVGALLLAVYVLVWATQLYGRAAGLLSILLYAACPNIMAHSQFVGTDAPSFLVATAICYHAWRYASPTDRSGHWQQLLCVALWLGLGQLTKQSLLLLYPVVAALLGLRLYRLPLPFARKVWQWCREMAVVAVVSLLMINTGFLFKQSGQPLKAYRFVSARYQGLQKSLSWTDGLPLPLPAPYLQGFDYVAFNAETGPGIEGRSSYGSGYFLGRKTDGQRIWYYYPICWLYKMPLGFWGLLCMALLGCLAWRRQLFWQGAIYLIGPVLFVMAMFCLFNTMYLGIRSTLMVAPLLMVFCGSVVTYIGNRAGAWALGLLLGWQLLSVGRWFPHFLPYTNELVWHKEEAHTLFADSNIYFQEAGLLVGEYLQRHPDVQWEPPAPVHGKVLVSVEAYYDWWNQGRMQWLRNLKLQPVGHLDSGCLLFEVP